MSAFLIICGTVVTWGWYLVYCIVTLCGPKARKETRRANEIRTLERLYRL